MGKVDERLLPKRGKRQPQQAHHHREEADRQMRQPVLVGGATFQERSFGQERLLLGQDDAQGISHRRTKWPVRATLANSFACHANAVSMASHAAERTFAMGVCVAASMPLSPMTV